MHLADRRFVVPYAPPLAWATLVGFLGARAIPGVEAVERNVYRRVIDVDGTAGWFEVRPRRTTPALVLTASLPSGASAEGLVTRVRRLFDLDADPAVVAGHFRDDALLGPLVRRLPGLRVPGAWDPFELGIRAILGQQVTVKGASTLAGRLVALCGRSVAPLSAPAGLLYAFPDATAVATADLTRLGVPARRRESLQAFARAVAGGDVRWDDHDVGAALRRLPGFGEWTAEYILMRACHDPDAFPASDLWLRRAAGVPGVRALLSRAEAWRPWRAYAAMHLWNG